MKKALKRVLALALLLGFVAATILMGIPARAATSPLIKAGFSAGASFYQAGICASDINADGKVELLVGNQNGRLYCFAPNGALRWSYNTGSPIQSTPACSDVDGDRKQEIFVGDMNGKIWGFDCNGRVLTKWGWPRQTITVGGLNGIFSSPAIGDITGAGIPDIVVATYGQRLYAWTYTGRLLPGFPYNNEDTIWSSPALADIDRDGVKEIVIGADVTGGANFPYPAGGLLYVFKGDTSILTGFPKWTPEVTWSSPAVADINRDGLPEIIVGTGHYYTDIGKLSTEGHRVYAYDHNGNLLPGWPASTVGCTFSSPAIGDINGDGVPEIAIGTESVNGNGAESMTVLEPNGRTLWRVDGLGGPTWCSPVLGDVNGDGLPEVIVNSGQRMYAWNAGGGNVFTMNLNNFAVGEPAVGEFNADGHVLLAFCTGDAPQGRYHGGSFYIYDCGPSSGSPGAYPWPMFRRTPDHHATVLIGNEPPPPPPPSWKKWYMAEGSTGPGMETWILVQNPGDRATSVQLTFMTPNGGIAGPHASLPPHSRHSFRVSDYVANRYEVSTMVASDHDVVVERSVYGGNTWAEGSIGVPYPSKTWYLPEGSTGPGFQTWVLVQNPNRTPTSVKLSYMTDHGPRPGPQVVIPACARHTFEVSRDVPGFWGVSTKVQADLPVVAERSMFTSTDATGSIGATLPATQWFLSEGSTGPGMQTWILIQNPTYPEAHVRVDYMTPSGPVAGPTFTIPSAARKTISVADTVNNVWSVSTLVSSDIPVIAECSMYGNNKTWATDSIGVTTPSRTWDVPEGSTGPGMETWLTVQNPGAQSARISISYMTPSGPVKGIDFTMPPFSRQTFFESDCVPNCWEVSAVVTSDREIVVSRATYGNNRTWGTESIGFAR